MKLSFSTLGCPKWTFPQILDNAAKMGFSGIEIRGIEGKMNANEIVQLSKQQLGTTKAMLHTRNLEIISFNTSASFHDPSTIKENMEEAITAINVCAQADIPSIRVFGNQIPSAQNAAQIIGHVADCICKLCEYANNLNVNVLLEIHGQFNTLEAIGRVIERCKAHSNFGIIWDVAHSDTVYRNNWRPFYELIKSYISHVHMKDHIYLANGSAKLCSVGDGEIPLADIIQTMERDGYAGYYSLEWEKKWVPSLDEPETAFPRYCAWMHSLDRK